MPVVFKVQRDDDLRRIAMPGQAVDIGELRERVAAAFGLGVDAFVLKWVDSDGDVITVATQADLDDAVASMPPPPRFQVLNKKAAPAAPAPSAAASAASPASTPTVVHFGVICDVCDGTIEGERFKCTTCADYDECARCRATSSHPHEFKTIASPLRGGQCPRFRGFGNLHHQLQQQQQRRAAYASACASAAAATAATASSSSSQAAPAAAAAAAPSTHHGVTCDGCRASPIVGERWKCDRCADFDFCSTCKNSDTVKHEHDAFTLVEPRSFRGGRCPRFGGFGGGGCGRFRQFCRQQQQQREQAQAQEQETPQFHPRVVIDLLGGGNNLFTAIPLILQHPLATEILPALVAAAATGDRAVTAAALDNAITQATELGIFASTDDAAAFFAAQRDFIISKLIEFAPVLRMFVPPPQAAADAAATAAASSSPEPLATSLLPSRARVVADLSYPAGTQVQAGESFVKMWRVRNETDLPWPESTRLEFVSGEPMGLYSSFPLPSAGAGEEIDAVIDVRAPLTPGVHESFWRVTDPSGRRLGERLGVSIVVVPEEDVSASFVKVAESTSPTAPTPTPTPAAAAPAFTPAPAETPTPAASVPVDVDLLTQRLVEMGFDGALSRQLLIDNSGDVVRTLQQLLRVAAQ